MGAKQPPLFRWFKAYGRKGGVLEKNLYGLAQDGPNGCCLSRGKLAGKTFLTITTTPGRETALRVLGTR